MIFHHPISLAIIGRPNVGKSTFFNRLARKQLAIVHDTPGVTRDWKQTDGEFFDIPVRLIDTAGLEEDSPDSIEGRMRQQTDQAIERADIILFMFDGRAGVTPLDKHFAALLRKNGHKVILLANKCENESAVQTSLAESYALGLGEAIPISSAHGHGLDLLYDALLPICEEIAGKDTPESSPDVNLDSDQDQAERDVNFEDLIDALEGDDNYDFADLEDEEDHPDLPLKIAIVGRPNVGKSSLLNKIMGHHRVMTGPEAGITRDSIAVNWEFKGKNLRLVDTAGLRKKGRIDNQLESLSARESLRAIRLSQITILVLDAELGIQNQDLKIASMVASEGRGLIIALNKWDLTKGREDILEKLKDRLKRSMADLPNVPLITVSALDGRNIEKLLDQIIDLEQEWKSRLRTAKLNKWLKDIYATSPPPLVNGRSNKLRYITQIKTRPPTFAIWAARPDSIPDHYKRFLINRLRDDFKIPRVPIRLLFRTSKNPFADKSK